MDRLGKVRFAAALLALVGSVQWVATHDWRGDPPRIRGWHDAPRSGDEPHYSVALHSLLFDGDLDLRDDYAGAAAGGWEAGSLRRGRTLDHHTILFDPETGRHESWQAIWSFQDRRPCDEPGCVPFGMSKPHGFEDLARVVEVPAHPLAFPMILAAALWPFSPDPEDMDDATANVLRFIGSLTLVATALSVFALGLGPRFALLAATLLGLASPWLAYNKSFFSEGTAAAVLIGALLSLVAGVPWAAALFAVVAMWMKPALVVVGAGWILERLHAGDRRSAIWITAIMALGGFALLGFNFSVGGRPLLSGAQAWVPADGLEIAWGTLFGKRYGLVAFVPWLAVVFVAMARAAPAVGQKSWERLRFQVGIPFALHWALLSTYGAMGGTCYGPRYWIPFLPWFAVCAAVAAKDGGSRVRAALGVTGVAAALLSIPAALQYMKVWDDSPYYGLLKMAAALTGR